MIIPNHKLAHTLIADLAEHCDQDAPTPRGNYWFDAIGRLTHAIDGCPPPPGTEGTRRMMQFHLGRMSSLLKIHQSLGGGSAQAALSCEITETARQIYILGMAITAEDAMRRRR